MKIWIDLVAIIFPREDDAYEYNGYFVTYISLRDTLENWS